MGEPVKPPAPVTVEVSDDENTATVTTRLEFVEQPFVYCDVCTGDDDPDICNNLPCGLGLGKGNARKDGRKGYFREVL
jgi:hypothetical protein